MISSGLRYSFSYSSIAASSFFTSMRPLILSEYADYAEFRIGLAPCFLYIAQRARVRVDPPSTRSQPHSKPLYRFPNAISADARIRSVKPVRSSSLALRGASIHSPVK